jgi:hypothetical protein
MNERRDKFETSSGVEQHKKSDIEINLCPIYHLIDKNIICCRSQNLRPLNLHLN